MATPPELIPIFPEGQGQRPQTLDIFPSTNTTVEIGTPLVDSPDIALTSITPQMQEISLVRQEQEQNKIMGVLHWLAEASGIPSLARSVISLAPEQIEEPVREAIKDTTGIEIRRATAGDYIVSGITLLGGLGVRGALKLIGASFGAAAEPVVQAGSKAVREGIRRLSVVEEAVRAGKMSVGAFDEPIAGRLSLGDLRGAVGKAIEMVRAGDDVLEDQLVKKDMGRLFQRLADAYGVGNIEVDTIPRIMFELGIENTAEGRVAFARLFEEGFREWGRTGKAISDLRKLLAKTLTEDEVVKAGLDETVVRSSIFRTIQGAIQFWRGAITGQLATHVRNLESGAVRMPLKFFEDVASDSIRVFTGQTGRQGAFVAPLENLTALIRGMNPNTKRKVIRLLKQVDKSENKLGRSSLYEKLFYTPVTDLSDTAVGGGAKRVLNFWQLPNRAQENLVRSIGFDAQLSKRLIQLGVEKEDLFRMGFPQWKWTKALGLAEPRIERDMTEAQVLRIWQQSVKKANALVAPVRRAITESVNEGLEVTYALRPSQKLWGHLFAVYEEFPAAALVHPFPRFFANSIKFLKEHSPFGLTRFMTKGQRNAIVNMMNAKGYGGEAIQREATEALGKVMSGFMMHAGALALRNSDMAGERWYEIKVGDRIIDARPFNPFAAYLLMAEYMRKIGDPEAGGPELRVRDFAEAFAGIRRFTGTGLFIFNLFDSDLGSFQRGIERTAGELVGGFTVPFRTYKDFLASAIPEEAVFRAKDGFFGPLISNLPLAAARREAEPRAAREGEVGVEPDILGVAAPTFRQLTGVIARTRTPVEAELINRDVNPRPGTGDPQLDRRIMELSGPEIDERITRVIRSGSYQRLSAVEKRERLSREVSRIRSRAKERVFREDRRELIDRISDELKGFDRARQEKELRRMRNSGRINERLERLILRRLRTL